MRDKKALQSKKFKCFLFSTLLIASILIATLVTQSFGWPISLFMSIGILAISIMCISYTINQAAVDKLIAGVSAIGGVNDKLHDVTSRKAAVEDPTDEENVGGI